MRFTKSHEREEGRLLRRGYAHSWAGLLLCWLPVVGLLLSASGFIRVMVRLTRRHRKRRRAYLVFSFIALAVCTGMLLGEIWVYSRDPEILDRTAQQVWTFIVGEENASTAAQNGADGISYGDMDSAGLGVADDIWPADGDWDDWSEDDWAAEGFAEAEDGFDWAAWEEAEWGLEGTDTAGEDWSYTESDLGWGDDDFWLDAQWSDEELSEEDSLTAAEDDLSALSEEEAAWLADESASILGESSAPLDAASASVGKGEMILPPLE